ncbi:MAG: DUF4062 domain-containing protein [bacterium]|nr:DUF4062 domain-containing protein [bacterium]
MNVKYQIFLSSTFDDLKTEREQVVKAILEIGHIPVGMEMFSAGDEEQWELIARAIDHSDYYVVIVAHRYGSTADDGISYTEKEYDYAVEQGVPALGFVIDKSARWPSDKMEADEGKRAALECFRSKVMEKHVAFWKDTRDLYGQSAIALGKQFNTRPRPGWIPATAAPSAAVADEISRLSKENSELRDRLEELELSQEPMEIRENRHLMDVMSQDTLDLNYLKAGKVSARPVSLLEVFRHAASSYSLTNNNLRPFKEAAASCLGVETKELSGVQTSKVLSRFSKYGLFESEPNPQYIKLSDKGRELLRGLSLQRHSPSEIQNGEDRKTGGDSE